MLTIIKCRSRCDYNSDSLCWLVVRVLGRLSTSTNRIPVGVSTRVHGSKCERRTRIIFHWYLFQRKRKQFPQVRIQICDYEWTCKYNVLLVTSTIVYSVSTSKDPALQVMQCYDLKDKVQAKLNVTEASFERVH